MTVKRFLRFMVIFGLSVGVFSDSSAVGTITSASVDFDYLTGGTVTISVSGTTYTV